MLIGSEAFYFTSLPGFTSFNKEVTANVTVEVLGTRQNHTFAD